MPWIFKPLFVWVFWSKTHVLSLSCFTFVPYSAVALITSDNMPLFSPEDIVLSWPSKLFLRGVCVAGLLLLASCLPYLGVRKDSSSGIQTMLAGLRKPFSVLKSRLQAWIFLFRGTEIIHNSFKRVSTCPLKRCLLCGFVLIRITV